LLSDKINQIKNDRSNGASQIARNALDALKFFVQTNKSTTRSEFEEKLKKVGLQLFEARANMAPVQNLVAHAVYNIINFKENDFELIQRFAVSTIDALSEQSKSAVKESATNAVELIKDCDCVVTCSDSSTVCETLKTAKEQGKHFKVVVAQSQTGSISYGEVMARFLESIDVSAKIFPDNQIPKHVSDANLVLIGVDSLLCDGSVINGLPSYSLAVAAKQSAVPFCSVCETTKANALSYLGKKVELKKGFDCVPANLVSSIITEKGVLHADSLIDVMKENAQHYEILGVT
jgi:translation initiation factor eIF-2B subunit delta